MVEEQTDNGSEWVDGVAVGVLVLIHFCYLLIFLGVID